MTQNEQVLKHLLDNKKITSLEAVERYGIMRLGARIYDLKKQGYPIKTYTCGSGNLVTGKAWYLRNIGWSG